MKIHVQLSCWPCFESFELFDKCMPSFYTNWAAQWIWGWRHLLPKVTIWVGALELTWWKEQANSCKMSSDSHIYTVVCGPKCTWTHTTKVNIKSKNNVVIFQVRALHFHKQCKHVQSSCLLWFWIFPILAMAPQVNAVVWCVCYFVVSIGIPVAYYGKCLFVYLLTIRWDLWSMLIWFDCFCIAKFWKLLYILDSNSSSEKS